MFVCECICVCVCECERERGRFLSETVLSVWLPRDSHTTTWRTFTVFNISVKIFLFCRKKNFWKMFLFLSINVNLMLCEAWFIFSIWVNGCWKDCINKRIIHQHYSYNCHLSSIPCVLMHQQKTETIDTCVKTEKIWWWSISLICCNNQ